MYSTVTSLLYHILHSTHYAVSNSNSYLTLNLRKNCAVPRSLSPHMTLLKMTQVTQMYQTTLITEPLGYDSMSQVALGHSLRLNADVADTALQKS